MKSALLLITCILCFAAPSYSQVDFHYPLEVGNVWVYQIVQPFQHTDPCWFGCDYERWEVTATDSTTVKGSCGLISAKRIFLSGGQEGEFEFDLCMQGNKLYRYPGTLGGDMLWDGEIESELMADFNKGMDEAWESQVFTWQGVFSILKRFSSNHSHDDQFVVYSYVRQGENDEGPAIIVGYNIFFHFYKNNVGFTSNNLYESSVGIALKGSYLDGMLSGDTTFVYTTSIEEPWGVDHGPSTVELVTAYPNPFNPSTVIRYRLPFGVNDGSPVHVKLAVYDAPGREVALLVNETRSPGEYTVTFHANALPSGLYLIELSAAGMRDVRKVMLVK